MRPRTTPMIALLALLSAVALLPSDARAGRPEARVLGEEALALYEQGDWEGAFSKFRQAEAEFHAPTNLLFMARCRARQSRLIEARRLYQSIASLDLGPDPPAQFQEAKAAALAEGGALDARIPMLVVGLGTAAPVGTVLRVDRATFPREQLGAPIPLDPGSHQVTVEAPGRRPSSTSVTLAEGSGVTRVQLELADPTPTERAVADVETEPVLWPAALGFAFGGTGVAAGIATALAANQILVGVLETCVDDRCPPSAEPDVSTAGTLADLSTASFIFGGAGLAAGTLLAIFPPTRRITPRVSLSPSGVTLTATF